MTRSAEDATANKPIKIGSLSAYPVVRKSPRVCSPLLLRVSASVNDELALAATFGHSHVS
jgi:hypothetical protein